MSDMGSLRASSTFLLLLLVAGTKTGEVPNDNYNQESSDVRNNLIDPHEEDPVGTSRSSLGLSTYRSSKEVIPVENSSAVSKKPQARTLSIPSFLGGEKETEDNQAASTSAIGEIAPLNDHPLWKVHKYQGIDLTPVALPTAYEPPSESYGPPAETYGPNEPRSPTESYGPPKDTYGPPESSGSTAGDSSAALSALDNLSGLTSILPEDGSSITSPLSSISSLASLLTQKPNSVSSTAGLSFEQLSALASLVSLLHAKSNGAPASTYGPPSLPSNIRGTELSSLASLVNLFPTETASSSGSLLTRLRSFLTRRPAILTSLLNALNLNSPSKPKGTAPEAGVANLLDLPNLPPISIPSNYKFQETGVGRPYVLKYSKPGPSTVPDNTYGPPPQDAVPIYEVPQHQQGEPVYPALNTASTYGISVPVSLTYGPSQDATSFQPSLSLSQEPFNSFHSPMVSYPSSIQEPRSPINSYGQPTSPYAAVSSETNYANSGFQTEYQNQFYNHAALTPAADTSASQSTYSLPQQHNIQSQLDGTSLEYASYQSEQTGPYSHHIYPTSHSGPFPDTSRSDTDVPSDDTPSKHRSDFLPSTLAAATGAGYSRVVFQRSQPETPPHDHEPARQAESEFDLLATSTSDVAQSTGSSTSSADESALSPKDSQLHKGNGLHRETNEFLMG